MCEGSKFCAVLSIIECFVQRFRGQPWDNPERWIRVKLKPSAQEQTEELRNWIRPRINYSREQSG
jgi:hypothetical protein